MYDFYKWLQNHKEVGITFYHGPDYGMKIDNNPKRVNDLSIIMNWLGSDVSISHVLSDFDVEHSRIREITLYSTLDFMYDDLYRYVHLGKRREAKSCTNSYNTST